MSGCHLLGRGRLGRGVVDDHDGADPTERSEQTVQLGGTVPDRDHDGDVVLAGGLLGAVPPSWTVCSEHSVGSAPSWSSTTPPAATEEVAARHGTTFRSGLASNVGPAARNAAFGRQAIVVRRFELRARTAMAPTSARPLAIR